MQPKFCESCNSCGVPMKRAIFSNFMTIHKLRDPFRLQGHAGAHRLKS